MKVFRLKSEQGRYDKVLLPAGSDICRDGILDSWTESSSITSQLRVALERMEYNQLKIRILSLFTGSKELPSVEIHSLLQGLKLDLSDKAVKMALIRYTRQGLLARSKKGGHYHYVLTEKGSARRDWLTKPR